MTPERWQRIQAARFARHTAHLGRQCLSRLRQYGEAEAALKLAEKNPRAQPRQ